MPVNKSVMNRHRDRHHQFAFPYDGFSGIQQRVVIAASLLLCAGDGSKIQDVYKRQIIRRITSWLPSISERLPVELPFLIYLPVSSSPPKVPLTM